MFLNTLSISEEAVRTALEKKHETGIVGKDARGGRCASQAERCQNIRKPITEHINKYPRVESHYCGQNQRKIPSP